ncbi:MAG: beta-carotene hydroxylase [Cyclobacteriaceae bacterium]
MLHPVLNILIVIATFLFMEGVAWFTHKYIMHGFLWSWHKSHHTAHDHVFEKNDLFALVFSIPSVLLIVLGSEYPAFRFIMFIGFGILAYGIFYFLFHDVLVHRRIKIKFKADHPYLKRIMNAHYVHHEVHSKEGGEAFGFLFAPKKYAKKKGKKMAG